jgi:hypothetical protein
MGASEYMAVSMRHAIVRIRFTRGRRFGAGEPGEPGEPSAPDKTNAARATSGYRARFGNAGTLAASLLLEAVLCHDDKQFFMLCFSVSAHCSTSGCFRLQAWRSNLARKHGRDSGLFRPPTLIRKRPARTRALHPSRGLPSGHAWLSRS